MISAEEIKRLREIYEKKIATLDEQAVRNELEDYWLGSDMNNFYIKELQAKNDTLQTLLNQAAESVSAHANLFDTFINNPRKLTDTILAAHQTYAAIEPYLTKEEGE